MTRRPIGVKTILLATAALLATVTLAACGDDEPTTMAEDDSASLSLEDLDGRAFASVRVDGHQLVPRTEIRLAFSGAELSAEAGCNHMFANVKLAGEELVVSNMGGTEMGCEDRLMAQEEWLTEFLTSSPSVALADDTLTLSGEDVVIELVEQETPDVPTGSSDEPTADGYEGDGNVVSE